MFVCPDCKTPLHELHCPSCNSRFVEKDGIPILLSRDERLRTASAIGAVYDDIYAHRTQVWEDQGRTPELISYLAELAADLSEGAVLEIGCGEGFLLAAVRTRQKFAVDISSEALRQAERRTKAKCAVALAERLPFPDCMFDMVLTVGVMEHFLDDQAATSEIVRVLRPGGHYLALIHIDRTVLERIRQKVREFIFPRPRPKRFGRWILNRLYINQPICRSYTTESARTCFGTAGLNVREIISKRSNPTAPLIGPHVRIYIAERP